MSAIEVVFICLISLFLLMGCVGFGTNSYSIEASAEDLNGMTYSDCVVFCSGQMVDEECIQTATSFDTNLKFLEPGAYLCSCALIKCNEPKEWSK
jgi:hypothetical protein